jgi:hypothetical protein
MPLLYSFVCASAYGASGAGLSDSDAGFCKISFSVEINWLVVNLAKIWWDGAGNSSCCQAKLMMNWC